MMYPYEPYPESHFYGFAGRSFFHALWSHIRFSILFFILVILLSLLIYHLQPYYRIVFVKQSTDSLAEPSRSQGVTRLPYIVSESPSPEVQPAASSQEIAAKQQHARFPKAILIYTVKKGDFLAGICRRFGADPSYVTWYNELQNPDVIYSGQTLSIPMRF